MQPNWAFAFREFLHHLKAEMPSAAASNSHRQLDLVLQRVRPGDIAAGVMGLALVLASYQSVGWPVALSWYATVLIAFALRAWLVHGKLGHLDAVADLQKFELQLALVHGLIGAVVSSAAWWFYGSLGPRAQINLMLLLVLWPAGGVSVLGVHPKSFRVYLICYFAVLSSAWFYFHPDDWLPLVGLLIMPVLLASISRGLSQLIDTISLLEREKDKLLQAQDVLIARLESAKTEAEQANLAKSRFLAAASHDLRQPLQAISLLSGVLRSVSVEKRVMDISTQLARASEALDTLFGAILDISRLEAGAIKPTVSEFSVDALFARLQSEYGARAAAKNLTFNTRQEHVRLASDPVLFERIIRNLVENAIRYTSDGGVTLALSEQTAYFEVSVTDSGIGIETPEQERIFQEYYQAAKSAEAQEIGMGLGLAIVRRLCSLLDFKISLQSSPGHGSAFNVQIPKSMVTRVAPARVAEPGVIHLDLLGKRVLVIDDDPLVREALTAALTAWGATVSPCAALSEMAALLEHKPDPDIAIIDYRLAEGPMGLEVAHQIHELRPAIQRIMMTGELLLDPQLEATSMPILRKPVSHEQLAKVLGKLVAQA
jgi:two-component system, sensor histidine kinase